MIKKIKIERFESHVKTELELCEGFNVICGTSNVGKTAILRALDLAVYGEWAGNENKKEGKAGPVRLGEKTCEVFVETDKGTISVEKGTGVNSWRVNDSVQDKRFELSSPGVKLPPEVPPVTGLNVKEIGGVKLRFNWSSQRDKHFLLEEIEGKPTSPSLVAAVVDEVAGLSGGEDLIRTIVTEKNREEKELTKIDTEVEQLNAELLKFADVETEQETLENVRLLLEKHGDLDKRLILADRLVTGLTAVVDRESDVRERFMSLSFDEKKTTENLNETVRRTVRLEDLSEKRDILSGLLEKTETVKETLETVNVDQTKTEGLLGDITDRLETIGVLTETRTLLDNTVEKVRLNTSRLKDVSFDSKKTDKNISGISDRLSTLGNMLRLKTEFDKNTEKMKQLSEKTLVDVEGCDDKIEQQERLLETLKRLTEVKKQLVQVTGREEKTCLLLSENNKETERLKKEIGKVVKLLGNCPFCGETLTENFEKHLLEVTS